MRGKLRQSEAAKRPIVSFLYFWLPFFAFFLAESTYFVNRFVSRHHRLKGYLDMDSQEPRSIFVVDLLQYFIRQTEAVNPPTTLRRHTRGRVVEVLMFSFKEAVVN